MSACRQRLSVLAFCAGHLVSSAQHVQDTTSFAHMWAKGETNSVSSLSLRLSALSEAVDEVSTALKDHLRLNARVQQLQAENFRNELGGTEGTEGYCFGYTLKTNAPHGHVKADNPIAKTTGFVILSVPNATVHEVGNVKFVPLREECCKSATRLAKWPLATAKCNHAGDSLWGGRVPQISPEQYHVYKQICFVHLYSPEQNKQLYGIPNCDAGPVTYMIEEEQIKPGCDDNTVPRGRCAIVRR